MKIKKGKAVKNDRDKPKMALVPSKAIYGIAQVFTYGERKYHAYNYKSGNGLDWDRPYNATQRHLIEWNGGRDIDMESGYKTLYHAGCSLMMLIDLVESKIGKDTRFQRNVTKRTVRPPGSHVW